MIEVDNPPIKIRSGTVADIVQGNGVAFDGKRDAKDAGAAAVKMVSRYPLQYWTRHLPIPKTIKVASWRCSKRPGPVAFTDSCWQHRSHWLQVIGGTAKRPLLR